MPYVDQYLRASGKFTESSIISPSFKNTRQKKKNHFKKPKKGEKKMEDLSRISDLRGLISDGLWTKPCSEFKVNLENIAKDQSVKSE